MKVAEETKSAAPAGTTASDAVEQMVVNLTCVCVVVLPWFIGGRLWWAQALNAGVGALAFIVVASSAANRRLLIVFPLFWLGFIFIGVLVCQALNPWLIALQSQPGLSVWFIQELPHVAWLPAGVSTDYFEMNTWRVLVYWTGPWLLACAWWVAVRRRRSGWQLAWFVLANGVAQAVLIFVQSFHPAAKTPWIEILPSQDPWLIRSSGSFSYPNAAGAFLYLSLAAGLALACRLQKRAREEGRDSGLSWVVLLGCLGIMASFFILGSRASLAGAAVIFGAGLFLMFGAAMLGDGRLPGLWVGTVVLVLAAGGALAVLLHSGDTDVTLERWFSLQENTAEPDQTRQILRTETVKMIKDRPWLGFGGGSYRYVSPDYFRRDGVFLDKTGTILGGLELRANQAHSDWLQLTMEFGLIGAAPLLAILLYWLGYALKLARWLGPAGWLVILGTLVVLVHATIDFPFYNAAVLTLFTLLLVSTVKNAVLEAKRSGTV